MGLEFPGQFRILSNPRVPQTRTSGSCVECDPLVKWPHNWVPVFSIRHEETGCLIGQANPRLPRPSPSIYTLVPTRSNRNAAHVRRAVSAAPHLPEAP